MTPKIIKLDNSSKVAEELEMLRIFGVRAKFILRSLSPKPNPQPSFLESLSPKRLPESAFFPEWLNVQQRALEKVCEQQDPLALLKFLAEIIYLDLRVKWGLAKSNFILLDIMSLNFDIYYYYPEIREEALEIIDKCEKVLGNGSEP